MTYEQFKDKIFDIGLGIVYHEDNLIGIGYPSVANKLLYFNPLLDKDDYNGFVNVKAINSHFYSSDLIKQSLSLVDKLLMTKIEDRGIYKNPFKDINN